MPTIDFIWEPENGLVYTFTVGYDTSPCRPSVINADPDDCHPEEGGVEYDTPELRLVEIHLIDSGGPHLVWQYGRANPGWPADMEELLESEVTRQCYSEILAECVKDAVAEVER